MQTRQVMEQKPLFDGADYKEFPRQVGHWDGLVRILNAELQETKRYRIHQHFEAKDDQWMITNTYMFEDGTSLTHQFDVIPTGGGNVVVTTDEGLLKGRSMEAMECGPDVINFKIINDETGKIQEMETVTLVGESERVRTAQLFNADGSFKGLLVVNEQRQS